MTFNVFDSAPMVEARAHAEHQRKAREAQLAAVLAGLGHPAGRAFLDALLAREYARPSYVPGDDFASTAYRQGRIAVLREIAQDLHAASQPTPTGA